MNFVICYLRTGRSEILQVGSCLIYHDIERVIGVQTADFMSFEDVQHAFGSPAEKEHANDCQQHANHLHTDSEQSLNVFSRVVAAGRQLPLF